jgi:hypothetical protein
MTIGTDAGDRNAYSRTTSFACLSLRRPRKTG